MISEAATRAARSRAKQVPPVTDEFIRRHQPPAAEEIRQPHPGETCCRPRIVAPLVKELAKLPEPQQRRPAPRPCGEEPELDAGPRR